MISFFPSRTVALEILGFSVRWYGILYLAGFAVGWWMLPRLQRLRHVSLSRDDWDSILTAAIVGVIVGGRLGFVFFYEPAYYLRHPVEVLAVWKGGMASHGGFIGVVLALLFVLRNHRHKILAIADIVVVPVAIGLALGRVGNLINQELYGTVTTLPWGIAIPDVEGLRHPTAIYAIFKNLLIAAVCFLHLRFARTARDGETAAIFLMLYGLLRCVVEAFRDQPYGWIDLGIVSLTRGQLLSVPILLAGAILLVWVRVKR